MEYQYSIEAMEKYNEETGNIAYENPKSIEELALGGELENWLYAFYIMNFLKKGILPFLTSSTNDTICFCAS